MALFPTSCLLPTSSPHPTMLNLLSLSLSVPPHSLLAASGALTPLGRAMALFPISPRHARMLLEVVSWQQQQQEQEAEPGADGRQTQGQAHRSKAGQVPGGTRAAQALPYALALAAALSVDSPFVHLDNVVSALVLRWGVLNALGQWQCAALCAGARCCTKRGVRRDGGKHRSWS